MATVFKEYKEESRANWGTDIQKEKNICTDQIRLGAILRIADACEVMARNNNDLIRERDKYKQWYEIADKRNALLWRKIAGLRGYITRLKKNVR